MSNKLFEYIQEATDRAKNLRTQQMARFHLGDVVYPLYQSWSPVLWGTVVEINPFIHKISINMNGIVRQYDPEELVLTNPELKPDSKYNVEREKMISKAEKEIKASFQRRRKASNPMEISSLPEDEDVKLEDSEEKKENISPLFKAWKVTISNLAALPEEEITHESSPFIYDTVNFLTSAENASHKMDSSSFNSNLINALYAFQTAYALGYPHTSGKAKNLFTEGKNRAFLIQNALKIQL